MADPLSQEQQLRIYLNCKNSTGNAAALLAGLFSDAQEAMLQALMVCGADFPDAPLPADAGKTARLSAGSGRILFIFSTCRDESDNILRFLRENEGRFFRASLSRCYRLPVPMQKIVAEAENNLLDAFVYPEGRIFPCRLPDYPLIEQIDNRITDLFRSGRYAQVRKILDGVPAFFRAHSMGVRDAVLLWNRIKLHADQQSILPPLEHLELFELVERFSGIFEMSRFLSSRLSALLPAKETTGAEQFARLVEYIDAHYTEKLEFGSLCSRFFISPSYASAVFQKKMHMGFSKYVARRRLRSACELMVGCPQLSIAEIGEMVGYRDYFYFTKVFRKTVGCTPTEYKRRMGQDGTGGAFPE